MTPHIPATQPPSLRVLVAEDGHVNRQYALRLLQNEGHSVTLASNGELAVNELRHGQFDVVFMDVEMPVMDGLTATREIRAEEQTRGTRTPIFALTTNTNREECFAAGMDGFLSKPLNTGDLRNVLGNVIDSNAA